jgi:uncharacterized membrane protein YfcA
VVGFINGIFGGGGGMIVVPVLTLFLKKPVKVAHATAILIILPITLVSAIVYFLNGDVVLFRTLAVTVGTVVGGALGALLMSKINSKTVGVIFSALMLIAGVKSAFF